MVILLFCLLTLQCPAYARSSRTVHLADGEMEQIYVEPGYSTLLKFPNHPEPGLIGDQDSFKVEYLKNIVAIKPLVAKGKTNLFVFTRDGQFNFQLVATKGQHDNVVYVEPKVDSKAPGRHGVRVAVPVEDLLKRKINKSAGTKTVRFTIESASMPVARTTIVLRVIVLTKVSGSTADKIEPGSFLVFQGKTPIKIENIFLDHKRRSQGLSETSGLILVRMSDLKTQDETRIVLNTDCADSKSDQLQVIIPRHLFEESRR